MRDLRRAAVDCRSRLRQNLYRTLAQPQRLGYVLAVRLSTARSPSKAAINFGSLCQWTRASFTSSLLHQSSSCTTHVLWAISARQMAKNQMKKIELAQAIVDVAWDPRSDNYLLIAQADGRIALYDADNLQVTCHTTRVSPRLRPLATPAVADTRARSVGKERFRRALREFSDMEPASVLSTSQATRCATVHTCEPIT